MKEAAAPFAFSPLFMKIYIHIQMLILSFG